MDIAASRHRSRDRSLDGTSFYGARTRDDVPMPDPYRGLPGRETVLDGTSALDAYSRVMGRGTNHMMDNR